MRGKKRGFELRDLSPPTDMHDLEREILNDHDAYAAYVENSLRHKIAKIFRSAMDKKGIPKYYFYKYLGIPQTQALRLLQKELGGNLSLYSIYRAATALNLEVSITIKKKRRKSPAKIKTGKRKSTFISAPPNPSDNIGE